VINHGLAETTSALMTRKLWSTDPSTADYYHHDPERAKKLLADAGHANGIEIEAWGWPDQSAVQDQEVVISQLAQSGIRIKLTPVSPAQAMQNMFIEKKRAMLITPSGGYPDPSQFYEAFFAKTALRNAGKIELPGFRPLLDATMVAQDQATRKAAFAKLQRFVVEQAMFLPQFILPGVTIATPKVKDFSNGLLMTPKFAGVWLAA
jgi:peptide/nickel transport system substrate-binding protein/glutathione transport system substrate-binding protein